jgi:2,3-bisphosphoglycerate-independent phosphoglycerate mutase
MDLTNNNEEASLADETASPDRPRPIVLVLLDSWGIAPKSAGNAFSGVKLKAFPNLIKNYPVALLSTPGTTPGKQAEMLSARGALLRAINDAGLTSQIILESEKLPAWYHLNGAFDPVLPVSAVTVISSLTGDRTAAPEQVLPELTKTALASIKKRTADFILIELSNLDLVSATGDLPAARAAAVLLDKSLGRIADAVAKQHGLLVVTAAYGHAEAMVNMALSLPEPGITANAVPFIIASQKYQGLNVGLPDTLGGDLSLVEPAGTLIDVTPTILKILALPAPAGLPGQSVI